MAKKQLEHGEVEMDLTPYMADKLKELFNCEIEMMQGTQEPLPDGRIRYTFKVDDEKGRMIMSFCLHVIGRLDKICPN